MTRLWAALRCLFGFHAWRYERWDLAGYAWAGQDVWRCWYRCARCGRETA